MLRPTEVYVGLAGHAEPLSLMYPRNDHEQMALIFADGDRKLGLILRGEERILYHTAICQNENEWSGVLVSGIEIEIDPHSQVDLSGVRAPQGGLVRHGEFLSVQTTMLGSRSPPFAAIIPVISNLSSCYGTERACFGEWQIVIGTGLEKRILHTVDVRP